MKRKGLLLFPAVFAMSLTACASNVHHEISEYIAGKVQYTNNFRILQLTDTHFGDKDNLDTHFKFMDLTINEANPDMIIVTGDLFTFASKATAKKFFDYLDSKGKPWTVTYGNHDEQCYFSVDWLTSTLNNYGSHCLYKDIQDDDVQGNANFAINLMLDDTHVFEQLIVMDSNRYYFGSYFGYDYFKQDQIDWYQRLVQETRKQNGGITVPSLMFYHIPLPEINDAWDRAEAGEADAIPVSFKVNGENKFGEKGEASCNPEFNSGFFDVIVEEHSTTGMYFGHDHVNNFIINYKGVDFAYGVKATDRVYYGDSMLGGRVITLHPDHSTTYEDYYHTYAEVK